MSSDPAASVADLKRVAEGNEQAFRRLFDRHGSLVLGFLCRMVGDRAEAEEILQDVFLEVWERAATFRDDLASPHSWILMITRSRALDRVRSRQSRVKREERWSAPSADRVESPVGTERLEQVERREHVESALADLPVEQRACVELSFFSGLSQRQISERLEVPLGTVKSRYLAGMRRLRDAIQPEVEGHPEVAGGEKTRDEARP